MAKKAITKEDLKRLMSETKKKLGNKKKIESPLAKYPFTKKKINS